MHTQNLVEAMRSLPLKVRFLGFQSDTRALALAGWGLSMREQRHFAYDQLEMQLAMKFETSGGPGVYAYSSPLRIDHQHVHQYARGGESAYALMEIFSQYGFDVIHVGNSPQFRVMPVMSGQSWASQFHPIDAMPQMERIETMDDFRFFKRATNTTKDLIVDPSSVPELLDLVLKAQRPMVEAVKRRENSRANEEFMRAGFELKPRHQVHAQIITLGASA